MRVTTLSVIALIASANWVHAAKPSKPTPATTAAAAAEISDAGFAAALGKCGGADERGMRKYVLVILKSGAKRVPDGNRARSAMRQSPG